MSYRPRIIDDQLRHMLAGCPAVMIDGARAVGKTTTAAQQANTVFRLEDASTLADVRNDPDLLVRAEPPVLIDEWQLFPRCMNSVKLAVDDDRTPGRFILTGSPSNPPPDPNDSGTEEPERVHSGAGRVVSLYMRPESLAERGIEVPTVSLGHLLSEDATAIVGTTSMGKRDYAQALLASGLPEIHDEPDDYRRAYVGTYLRRLVRRDMTDVVTGQRRTAPGPVTRWLRAYAQATASEANFSTIRDTAHRQDGETSSRPTIDFYRSALEALGVIEIQPAWCDPVGPIPTAKSTSLHHLVDPALAAHLLDLTSVPRLLDASGKVSEMARGMSVLGQLFQSLVTQSVRVYASANDASVYWLGTKKSGSRRSREIDIIVEDPLGRVVAIEVKFNGSVDSDDCKHLRWLRGELGYRWADGIVVNTGSEAYRRDDGIAVVPAALLGP